METHNPIIYQQQQQSTIYLQQQPYATTTYFPSTSPFTHHQLLSNPLRHSIDHVSYPNHPNIIRSSIDDDNDDDDSDGSTSSTTSSDDEEYDSRFDTFSLPGATSASSEDYIPSSSTEDVDPYDFKDMRKMSRVAGRKGSTFEMAELCAAHQASPRRHSVSFPLASSSASCLGSSSSFSVAEKEKQEKSNKAAKGSASKWLSKTRQNISYSIVSRETQEAFSEISALFEKMFADFPYSNLDLMLGLGILNDYYKATHVSSQSLVEDVAFVTDARYYMKFASCCYGWKFIYGILQLRTQKFLNSVVTGDAANVKALCDHCGVDSKDIMAMKWTSTLYDNGHYVCFCHEKKTIVVAMRGSFHVRDALTDLVASTTPFIVGSAHTGFLRTATAKMQKLVPVILKCRAMKPDYKVVFVGHSLGAGVSSLMTLLFHKAYPDIPVHCYAYGVPSVASIELAIHPETLALIDSFVLDDDVVPRLSFATLAQLKTVVMQILQQSKPGLQRAFHWMSGSMGDGMTHRIASILKCAPRPEVKSINNQIIDVSCFPPGRVWHLFPRCDHVTLPPLSSSSSYPPSSAFTTITPSLSSSTFAMNAPSPATTVHIPVQAIPSVIPPPTSTPTTKTATTTTTTTTGTTATTSSRRASLSSSAPYYSASSQNIAPTNVNVNLRSSSSGIRLVDDAQQKSASSSSKASSFFSSWRSSSAPQKSFFPSSTRRASTSAVPPRVPVTVTRGPVGAAPLTTGTIPAPPTVNPAEAVAERYDLSPQAKRRITNSKKVQGYVMEHSSSTLFHEIVISDTMYSNHMPNKYEVALESYFKMLTDHHRRNSTVF